MPAIVGAKGRSSISFSNGENRTGRCGVAGDLGFEFRQAAKSALVAEPLAQDQFEVLSVKIHSTVQKMSLDCEVFAVQVDRGAATDVDDRLSHAVGPARAGRVNPGGRQGQPRNLEVRRRKAQLTTAAISHNDASSHSVGSPQHAADRRQVACPNGLANARAADNLTGVLLGGQ